MPILWGGCRRHSLELYSGAAWSAVFPEKSKAPADAKCERLHKHVETHGIPSFLDGSCPNVFKETSFVFKTQKERLADLAKHIYIEAGSSETMPRSDYEYLWSLVKVIN